MEVRNKTRKNTNNIKRQALEYVYEARGLANANKVESSLQERINTIEKDIQKVQLDRRHPNDFCRKENKQIQIILSELNSREAKFLKRTKWVSLSV